MTNGFPKRTVTEDLGSQVDGIAATFTVTGPMVVDSLLVHLNGVRLLGGSLVGGDDFEEQDETTFQMAAAPRVGDTLQVQYEADDSEAAYLLVRASGIDPTA
jgi:hypothetical protein